MRTISRLRITLPILALCTATLTASAQDKEEGWTELFNGKDLTGWTACLGKGGDEKSQGTDKIFTVRDGVIHIYQGAEAGSKQSSANLYHESTWSNFRLQVEYRWLDRKFQPRTKDDRDAGILFHIHGDPKVVWPSSLEMQMGDGKIGSPYVSGDLFVLGATRADSASPDGKFDPDAKLVTRGGGAGGARAAVTVLAEKPHGEWNTSEIVVHGSEKAEFYLNGILVNVIHNMKFKDADGKWKPLGKGHISIQAEWAELEYRAVRVKEIKE
ncbi:DUF1080 domain-containing protein [Akkermansiaceae bacterium]|nr:DUF1080 domain-containing protein [Akkermansiaceae bacterium]